MTSYLQTGRASRFKLCIRNAFMTIMIHAKFHFNRLMLKSVQSTLDHLQSPPKQMQSQRNYDSFSSKSHLHGMILLTMLAQNLPKRKDNALLEQFAISNSSISNRGDNCDMFEIMWQVLILEAVLH